MKIGELAAAAGTPVETIRYYEREGLLPTAARTEGNYRIYGPGHVERLAFVRHCRSLDMALDEVRVLLRVKDAPQAGCGEVNMLLDEHIHHVATRIRELRQLERQLKSLRAQCGGAGEAARCGILDGLAQPVARAPAGGVHVEGAHGRSGGRRAADRRRGSAG
ncbi:Cd(II)/Pb(II)-responsive transcriptional regulator [Methylibium sp. Root1272]|jgi:Cd(II)/Pb(II)-responsive transcriptional regulator|uniref:Cd(II)/Pb(II)-responsive transcriptional regulator n=1 Tax=Methylibium sp. Root1272 TaxID=1736441 RepID=UPI0006FA1F7A|nr:Cd(II)/Pb(II)-responsive transcriptional regulator [Methylibium sp. Root1272]KQW76439.1 Cd(II)/Pb(II)-responsive transcriptional regulator [Methylibium sp. Root1272]